MTSGGTRIDAYNERRVTVASRTDVWGIDGVDVECRDERECVIVLQLIPQAQPAGLVLLTPVEASGVRLSGAGAAGWSVRKSKLLADTSALAVELVRTSGPATAQPLTVTIVHPQIVPPFDSVRLTLGRAGREDVVTASSAPAPAPADAPEIDYLAKDYAAFRQLMLDRMAITAPTWTETHAADVGIVMVEVLAYAADYLSYYQDAVGTETYLTTARLRPSVRRHARAVCYSLTEGCAPRAWLYFAVTEPVPVPQGLEVSGKARDMQSDAPPHPADADQRVYVTLVAQTCDPAKNAFALYDEGADEYTLPTGATTAQIVVSTGAGGDPEPAVPVEAGDVLVFQQTADPVTGAAAEADPHKRHAVRAVRVSRAQCDQLAATWYAAVEWAEEDALPFDLPVTVRSPQDGRRLGSLAAVLGNIVPAEFGAPVAGEKLGYVVDPLEYAPALLYKDLTYSVPYELFDGQPASAFAQPAAPSAVPAIVLDEYPFGDTAAPTPRRWTAVSDLLASAPDAPHFVVESESDRRVTLRFGDGVHGRMPDPGSLFVACYRVGNGPAGDVGADTLVQLDQSNVQPGSVTAVRNPLPSAGSAEPMPLNQARIEAPAMIRTQQRCVVERDYVAAALLIADVRAAAADTVFTGSGRTIRLFVQRAADGGDEDAAFVRAVRAQMEPLRLIGAGLAVFPPSYVPIDAKLLVTRRADAEPEALRTRVDGVVSQLLGALAFTFGQSVYPSPLIRAVMSVTGVRDARVVRFARFGASPSPAEEPPAVAMRAHEIAQFDRCTIEYATETKR